MLTFLGVVFSITLVAVQMGSAQFSPRVVRTFSRSSITKVTLGTFMATFIYALLVQMPNATLRKRAPGCQPGHHTIGYFCVCDPRSQAYPIG
jgi:uncharacterized membrane protein